MAFMFVDSGKLIFCCSFVYFLVFFSLDLGRAIRAAEMRLELSLAPDLTEALAAELRGLRARLN